MKRLLVDTGLLLDLTILELSKRPEPLPGWLVKKRTRSLSEELAWSVVEQIDNDKFESLISAGAIVELQYHLRDKRQGRISDKEAGGSLALAFWESFMSIVKILRARLEPLSVLLEPERIAELSEFGAVDEHLVQLYVSGSPRDVFFLCLPGMDSTLAARLELIDDKRIYRPSLR